MWVRVSWRPRSAPQARFSPSVSCEHSKHTHTQPQARGHPAGDKVRWKYLNITSFFLKKMSEHTYDPFNFYFEKKIAKLTSTMVFVILVVFLADMLEFYDFGILSSVLPLWIKEWHLTGAQIGLLVTFVGVGACLGSYIVPTLADRFGRRPIFFYTLLLISISTALISITPEGDVGFVYSMRFLQGFGIGALYSIDYSIVQEYTPPKYRGFWTGFITVMIPGGVALSSIVTSLLLPLVGWRPLYLIGAIPIVLSLIGRFWLPESPRWLYSRGRFEEAARAFAWGMRIKDQREIDEIKVELERQYRENPPLRISYIDQFKLLKQNKNSVIAMLVAGFIMGYGWYGYGPYIPTFLALGEGLSTVKAAAIYSLINLGAIGGRLLNIFLIDVLGRRLTLTIYGAWATVFTFLTAFVLNLPFPWALVAIVPWDMATDPVFSGTMVHANELAPTRARSTMSGLTYGSARVGSILSPIFLGLSLGAHPSTAHLTPYFFTMAVLYLGFAAIFRLPLTVETKERPLTV